MQFWEYIFWTSCIILFYNYAGYAIIAYLLTKARGRNPVQAVRGDFFPTVSFIVAVYNEEDCIRDKLINSLKQNYPSEKIEFLFVTDGTTDSTNTIISQFPDIKLLYIPERRGKSAAVNRAVQLASNEILVFSDANTILNAEAVLTITRHYSDSKVGGVAGEKKVISNSGNDKVGQSEGLYWKYESLLKKIDSDFLSVVGAAGELFSLRRTLYIPLPHQVILDDFIISMRVAEKGYRIIYEPEAYASELPSLSIRDEEKRKTRIAAGGFQSIAMLPSLFYFWKNPGLSFLYFSHRVLRWTLSPLCLPIALISNFVLVLTFDNSLYIPLLLFQLIFYFFAFAGKSFPLLKNSRIIKLPFYFVFMNISVYKGFFRYIRGRQPATWEKASRTLTSM